LNAPPGVSGTDFSAALSQITAVVGDAWVFTSESDVDLYRDAYSPLWGTAEERTTSAAVAPTSVERVQQIVRIAKRYKIPVFPISTGKNLVYGGPRPATTDRGRRPQANESRHRS
jgi:(+)-pinoresinol hydroxylase